MSTSLSPLKRPKFVMTQRQKLMWPVLILGAFFEGFDDSLINVALPYISQDFGLTTQNAGFILSVIAVGTMVAFFASRLADSLGRRRVFLWCVVGYSLASLLTAFAFWLPWFVATQFIARIFLIGCWSIGYVIVCEEFKAEHRGWGVGRFQLTAVVGGLLIGILLPVVMHFGLGWRALYVVGALPLIPVLFMHKRLPETESFLKLRYEKQAGVKPQTQNFFAVWRQPHTKYLIIMSIVWLFMYFGIKGSMNFFSKRVVDELQWTPMMVSIAVLTSTVAGIFIIGLNGKLLDVLGRKRAAVMIIAIGSVFSILTYMVDNTIAIMAFNIVALGSLNSFLIVGSTLTNELFPTEIRGNGMAWSNNIFGRLGQILVPVFIGSLALFMTLAHAIAIAMALPIISLLLIVIFIPRTPPYQGAEEVTQDVFEHDPFVNEFGPDPFGQEPLNEPFAPDQFAQVEEG